MSTTLRSFHSWGREVNFSPSALRLKSLNSLGRMQGATVYLGSSDTSYLLPGGPASNRLEEATLGAFMP
jgi:hypothetical protein